jgi:hypothetical protein
MFLIVFFQTLQAREHRRILFWLAIFCPECVVAQRIQADGLGLIRIEVLRKGGAAHVSFLAEMEWKRKITDMSFAKLVVLW